MMIHVTVWNEFRHEVSDQEVIDIYPNGIHMAIKDFLDIDDEIEVRTATLDQPQHGLTDDLLAWTDVMIWWAHKAHGEVDDAIVAKVHQQVLQGMGIILLHSSHYSKIFQKLMGTTCSLKWRNVGENERLWLIDPTHPIAKGVQSPIEIPHEEMYGEAFDVPAPDETVFLGWYKGGEVFRSGICYKRAFGKVFYFQPGHETYPIYYMPEIQKVITNAVHWAKPLKKYPPLTAPMVDPIEDLS